MFGMEKKKKKKLPDWPFDLELEVKDPSALRKRKEEIASRVAELKAMLRQGEDKKSFDQAQTLLHGYLAMQKVVERAARH